MTEKIFFPTMYQKLSGVIAVFDHEQEHPSLYYFRYYISILCPSKFKKRKSGRLEKERGLRGGEEKEKKIISGSWHFGI